MFDRDRILDAIDLGALADELLGPRRGTARSAMWPCPSSQHAQTGRTPPVSIFRSQAGDERWHCHGCGIGGSAIDLVMVTRGVPVRDALEELAGRVGMRDPLQVPEVVRPRPKSGPSERGERAVTDPDGLAAYVEECSDRLWRPEGRSVLRWLTHARGLPEEVLRTNHVGADPGGRAQARPDGMPAAGWAAVLPAFEGGRPVFAQLRSLNPLPGRPRYLNAATRLAPNPRVAMYEPADVGGRCVIVTEGIIDALSANAAGFRSAAVLGAALAGIGGDGPGPTELTGRLTRVGATLVLAFDADAAGDRGAHRLQHLLRDRGAKVARIHVPPAANDLNDWMRGSPDWQRTITIAARTAISAARPPRSLARR